MKNVDLIEYAYLEVRKKRRKEEQPGRRKP